MATNFPAGLDDFANYVDGVTIIEAALLNDMQFAIEALEAKVGVNSSAVGSSHDYKLANDFNLSAYTNEDSDGNAMLRSHAYKAATDGFVTVYGTTDGQGRDIRSYVGLTSDPAGAGDIVQYTETYGNGTEISQNFPVAKDEYFEIISANATLTIIRWKSIGALSKPVDNN